MCNRISGVTEASYSGELREQTERGGRRGEGGERTQKTEERSEPCTDDSGGRSLGRDGVCILGNIHYMQRGSQHAGHHSLSRTL